MDEAYRLAERAARLAPDDARAQAAVVMSRKRRGLDSAIEDLFLALRARFPDFTFSVDRKRRSPRYLRIFVNAICGSSSTHWCTLCFIDRSDGSLLRSSGGWDARPVKGRCGTVYDDEPDRRFASRSAYLEQCALTGHRPHALLAIMLSPPRWHPYRSTTV